MSARSVAMIEPGVLGAFADASGRAALAGGRVGLEKEALRVAASGFVSPAAHPSALGSPLTHPCITTDFSEALIELVTPAMAAAGEVLDLLGDLHRYVYRHIGDERLWATSMPCVLHGGAHIPLARYGSSNAARMKTVYRRGLGNRYGRIMQIIAGVHFNFSVDDALWPRLARLRPATAGRGGLPAAGIDNAPDAQPFRSEAYMGMVRNLQRLGWLVPYLFGASPAVCKSFVQDAATDLESFDDNTFFYPYATSLRMGDIGYQNRQEEGTGMKACYDSLDAYIKSLTWAIETACPQYEAIGIKVNDRYEQLNDHVLQIENEYYSTVRPKQLTDWMERPTLALRRRGVRYVELRSLDVNAYHPLGIDLETMSFLRLLMLYSLLTESPRIDARERRAIDANQVLAAHRGREPGLRLQAPTEQPTLTDWAARVLDAMAPLAELIDGHNGDDRFTTSLRAQQAKVADSALTPSARMLTEMRERGEGFAAFARRLTEQHREGFLAGELSAERSAWLADLAATSLDRQRAIEAADDIDFDEFLRRYFAQSEAHPVDLPAPV
jgi:glutamate--cysteine ligase